MGKAMIIIVVGLIVSVGYTFSNMSEQQLVLTKQSTNDANKAMAENLAFTGVQLAIKEFNDEESWRGPETRNLENGNVEFSLEVIDPDTIEITSSARINHAKNDFKVIATYDISQKQSLVPEFNTPLGITTNNFDFSMGGSSNINGNDKSGSSRCSDQPGVSVNSQSAKDKVGTNSRIDGNPEDHAKINPTDFQPYADLVESLADKPSTKHISGNYKGSLGTKDNPGTFFIDDYTKLTGGISEGYGIMVMRSAGELDLEGELDIAGNFTFNGLVIFENAWEMNARGTPTINGSVIVGSTDDGYFNIDINGNVQLQYDCTAKDYADKAVNKSLDTNLYKQVSIYEE